MQDATFRAKRIDNDAWVVGTNPQDKDGTTFLFCAVKNGNWLEMRFIPVKRDTVCACTVHKDANGNSVFENDILRNRVHPEWFGIVMFDTATKSFGVIVYVSDDTELPVGCLGYIHSEWDIVGNIYENAELLKPAFVIS